MSPAAELVLPRFLMIRSRTHSHLEGGDGLAEEEGQAAHVGVSGVAEAVSFGSALVIANIEAYPFNHTPSSFLFSSSLLA